MSVVWVLCHGRQVAAVPIGGQVVCPYCNTAVQVKTSERRERG